MSLGECKPIKMVISVFLLTKGSSNAILSCGVHTCPQRCHQLSDHTKMQCDRIVKAQCSQGHVLSWRCSDGSPSICDVCDWKRRADEKRQEQEFERERTRQVRQQEHADRST